MRGTIAISDHSPT
jgi:hypothetical protein